MCGDTYVASATPLLGRNAGDVLWLRLRVPSFGFGRTSVLYGPFRPDRSTVCHCTGNDAQSIPHNAESMTAAIRSKSPAGRSRNIGSPSTRGAMSSVFGRGGTGR
jgi:hypothetical protein